MPPKYSLPEAKQRLEAFCAYQERCDQEVRKKLSGWGFPENDADILISDLIQHNFLNEERFACAFVSGKFRIKKWGRVKITRHLKQKKISDYSIRKGLQEINESEYLNALEQLMTSKYRLINAATKWDRKVKLQRYLLSKGYENQLVNEVISNLTTLDDD